MTADASWRAPARRPEYRRPPGGLDDLLDDLCRPGAAPAPPPAVTYLQAAPPRVTAHTPFMLFGVHGCAVQFSAARPATGPCSCSVCESRRGHPVWEAAPGRPVARWLTASL